MYETLMRKMYEHVLKQHKNWRLVLLSNDLLTFGNTLLYLDAALRNHTSTNSIHIGEFFYLKINQMLQSHVSPEKFVDTWIAAMLKC